MEDKVSIFCKLAFTTSLLLTITSLAYAQQEQENLYLTNDVLDTEVKSTANLKKQLIISSALVDDFIGRSLEIFGENFDNGDYLLVTLGNRQLSVINDDSDYIEAVFPPNMEPGFYILTISTAPNAMRHFDAHGVIIAEIAEDDEEESVVDEVACNYGNCTNEFFQACNKVFRWNGPFRVEGKKTKQLSIKYFCTCCNK